MTQKGKLELLEKKFEKSRPYRFDERVHGVGLETLTWLWRTMFEIEAPEDDDIGGETPYPNLEELAELGKEIEGEYIKILWEEFEVLEV